MAAVNYYNEIDPYAAAWLRMLIELKLIPTGEVDERSITDVSPDELSRYTQCHFFAGIGGWSLALRLAGVPDDAEVDTGSCPCPPFSSAGKKKLCPECGGKPIPHPLKTGIFACVPCGHEWFADERHLYPELLRIIAKRRSPVFFGEQVVGTDGLVWLTGVRATLEAVGYAFGASDLCSAGVASPNIRQRLYWVADATGMPSAEYGDQPRQGSRREAGAGDSADGRRYHDRLADSECARRETSGMRSEIDPGRKSQPRCSPCGMGNSASGGRGKFGNETQPWSCGHADGASIADGLGDTSGEGSQRYDRDGDDRNKSGRQHAEPVGSIGEAGGFGGMADTDGGDASAEREQRGGEQRLQPEGFWCDSVAILCRDGKHRRISTEPALFPLADGLPYKLARRGSIRPALLKGAGNAINPHVAAEFIRAFFETKGRF